MVSDFRQGIYCANGSSTIYKISKIISIIPSKLGDNVFITLIRIAKNPK